jgi:outer membrane protein assembly factor BamE (lipoprotein component of BamABCDE complex)
VSIKKKVAVPSYTTQFSKSKKVSSIVDYQKKNQDKQKMGNDNSITVIKKLNGLKQSRHQLTLGF